MKKTVTENWISAMVILGAIATVISGTLGVFDLMPIRAFPQQKIHSERRKLS